jgi:hypothetical protein
MAKVSRIHDTRFVHDRTNKPMTMQQFQDLTNEILVELNKLTVPHMLDADYVAQVLMSALHGTKMETGFISKYALYESCIHRISSHLTYDAVQEIQARIKAKNKPEEITTVPAEPHSDEEIVVAPPAVESSVH